MPKILTCSPDLITSLLHHRRGSSLPQFKDKLGGLVSKASANPSTALCFYLLVTPRFGACTRPLCRRLPLPRTPSALPVPGRTPPILSTLPGPPLALTEPLHGLEKGALYPGGAVPRQGLSGPQGDSIHTCPPAWGPCSVNTLQSCTCEDAASRDHSGSIRG